MERRLVTAQKFWDAPELITAITKLVEISGRDPSTVYVSGEVGGFFRAGTARLIEETLEDGSTVFDIELGE